MQSRNKKAMTAAERRHVERVKDTPCAICDEPAPSEAHEIKQGHWYTTIALCAHCHRGELFGLHGQKRMWKIHKMDELDALNVTLSRVWGGK